LDGSPARVDAGQHGDAVYQGFTGPRLSLIRGVRVRIRVRGVGLGRRVRGSNNTGIEYTRVLPDPV
jgi:hypothetical protein